MTPAQQAILDELTACGIPWRISTTGWLVIMSYFELTAPQKPAIQEAKRRRACNTGGALTDKRMHLAVANEPVPSLILTYKYRLLPNKRQHAAFAVILESQRQLYNGALEHRILAHRRNQKSITLYTQMKELAELRQDLAFSNVPSNLQRWTLRRLEEAYQGFFRRVKAKGEKAGFPRFRGKGRWNSFGFSEFSGIQLKRKRLYFRGMPGGVRVHLHRALPDGKPLSCTFTRDHKGWSVCIHCRVPLHALPATGRQIGVDVGLKELAVLSTGEAISNPRVAKRAEREMRRRQRALARCKKGSNRRMKVRQAVTRCHARIKNTRNTYLHQVSCRLVGEHDLIAVEKLNVKGLAGGILAKSVRDAGWSKLNQMLAYKAAKAGRELVEVKAAGTSQTCPDCGQVKAKTLAERVHRCDCGCVMNRDHASAVIVLQRARSGARVSQREALACA